MANKSAYISTDFTASSEIRKTQARFDLTIVTL